MTLNEELVRLSNIVAGEMTLSEDKTMITISEDGISKALKESKMDIETIDKVHAATKKVFNATLHAAGEMIADKVFSDENIPQEHTVVFHMNQFANDSFTHSFTRLPSNEVEVYSVYEQELQGNDYRAISDHLKERFKVEL